MAHSFYVLLRHSLRKREWRMDQIKRFACQCKGFLSEFGSNVNPDDDILGEVCNTKYIERPNMIFLAGGYPNPDLFPFQSASFLKEGRERVVIDSDLMVTCLQYGNVEGHPKLIDSLKALMTKYHKVNDWEAKNIVITNGASDALSKSLELILEPTKCVLAENPLFGTITSYIKSHGATYIEVERDDFGMKPKSLLKALQKSNEKGFTNPIIYVNFMTIERSRPAALSHRLEEVYGIARDHRALLIEVDPFIMIPKHGLDQYSPSLLSLDTENIVLRCDTTSHLFGPGFRVGSLTAPARFAGLVATQNMASIVHASHLSQVIILKALNNLKEEELHQYSSGIYYNYEAEAKELKAVAQSCLRDKTEWSSYPCVPFLWFKMKETTQLLTDLSYLQNNFVTSLNAVEGNAVTLGISALGTTKEAKIKICHAILELLKRYK